MIPISMPVYLWNSALFFFFSLFFLSADNEMRLSHSRNSMVGAQCAQKIREKKSKRRQNINMLKRRLNALCVCLFLCGFFCIGKSRCEFRWITWFDVVTINKLLSILDIQVKVYSSFYFIGIALVFGRDRNSFFPSASNREK